MRNSVLGVMLIFSMVFFSKVQAGYVADFEAWDKKANNKQHLRLTSDGTNASVLFNADSEQPFGIYKVNGVTYSAQRDQGQWRVINLDEMMKNLEMIGALQGSAKTPAARQIVLQDMKQEVRVGEYQGNLYKVIENEGGKVVKESTLVASKHEDVVRVRDDYMALFETAVKRASKFNAGNRDFDNMMTAREAMQRANGGILRFESVDGGFTLLSIEPAAVKVALPAPPQNPLAVIGAAKPEEIKKGLEAAIDMLNNGTK